MLEKIPIVSFIVFAIWYSMLDGEIFGKLGNWLEEHLPERLHKPVFSCPVCMAGMYGAAIYWLIWGAGLKEWVVVNIAAIGLNAIIAKIFPDDN